MLLILLSIAIGWAITAGMYIGFVLWLANSIERDR
ncbi:hypothetical protein KQCUZIGB_CDS0012 [Pectobacterium phage Ymer]|uniref:Uncharacterized protein n=2 Tax=unclassified Caudoviricetes TaxID=2788787 RepID=A0AB39ABY9_9CAUD|nr:hypothetical protein Ymer_58 [Pectobacterium phage Ymer]